ncbi:MAG: aminotransferase class V-fold PLP-dependent enzyme [Candidatus Heimdallarchaeota archaeon]|nr:aminotransferase class V-fold PLP-dependent enzyme [Candidatus Heimdallarchaeota archaeon]
MDSYIEKIREESPTFKNHIYLNHASTGPLHGRTAEALKIFSTLWAETNFEEVDIACKNVKSQFAQLINATAEEIVFTPDVTHGTKLAVNMLEYDEKSNIVCYWNDYPGQVYQALYLKERKNVEYRPVPDKKNEILIEGFADRIDENTKIVLLSHVQWISGYKSDVKEIAKIAHENGAYILVDSIQSTGAMVNDVKDWDVDFLTCGVAKWLLGPNHKGLFYINKKLIDEFYPPFAGYHGTDVGSLDQPYWNVNKLEFLPSADKFMDTNPGNLLYFVANEGLKILLDYGAAKIESRILKLTDYLFERLNELEKIEFISSREKKYRSGIVNARISNNVEIVKRLKEKKIIVSSRYGGIRISPHFYNTEEDIDKLIELLKQYHTKSIS